MENRKIVVNIRNVVTRLPELRFEEPLNWIIEEGQQWGVIGPPGKEPIAVTSSAIRWNRAIYS